MEDLKHCRHCNSSHLYYQKVIGYGPKAGKVYHYKIICLGCNKRYNVERSKEMFELVKDKGWVKSKSYMQYEKLENGEGLFPKKECN